MYLPRMKEEVEKFAKSKTAIVICCVLCLAVAAAGGWLVCRHYDRIERANSHDVTQTVRDAEELNRDAQTELDRARTANQDAADANQNAQRAADDLADSTTKLSDINRSDTDAIDAAERVFNDVERANQ